MIGLPSWHGTGPSLSSETPVYPPEPTSLAHDGSLPGERSVSESLLARAVSDINRIHNQKGLELARLLGVYLLKTFFGGSVASFRSRRGRHVTFRALARRTDLEVSYTALWTSIGIVEQLQQLPESVAGRLTYSHHRSLLTVKSIGDKIRLARTAVDDGLTTRQLDGLVAQVQRATSGARTGRPRTPALIKGIRKVDACVGLALTEAVDESWIASRPPEELQRLLADVQRSVDALQQVASLLERYTRSDDNGEEPDAG